VKPAEVPAPLKLDDVAGVTKTELSTTVATIPTPLVANTTQATIPEPEKKEPQLFICASFNDWTPMRMKTEKVLNLEKYGLHDDDIPEEFADLDNIT